MKAEMIANSAPAGIVPMIQANEVRPVAPGADYDGGCDDSGNDPSCDNSCVCDSGGDSGGCYGGVKE